MSFESETSLSTHSDYRVIRLETANGPLKLHATCPPEFFPELILDSGLGHFAHYSSIIQKLSVFQRIASQKEGRVSVVLADPRTVVAYAACWYPDNGERWSKLGELMYEMGVVEVSRNYRHLGLARSMIGEIIADEFFEYKIAYINGFSWHWDLDGTGLTTTQYRRMMLGLLKKFRFQEQYTNEPNIALREENLFMARVGSKVSDEDQKRFRNLRFGIVNRG